VEGTLLSHRRNGQTNALESSKVSSGDLAGLAIPGPKALHGFHNVHALFHLSKDHMLASSHLVLAVQMKNWELFVLGLVLAMDEMLGPVCFRMFLSSNFSP
jgi:hypothetical protein